MSELTLEQKINTIVIDYGYSKGLDLGTITKDVYPLITKPLLDLIQASNTAMLDTAISRLPEKQLVDLHYSAYSEGHDDCLPEKIEIPSDSKYIKNIANASASSFRCGEQDCHNAAIDTARANLKKKPRYEK